MGLLKGFSDKLVREVMLDFYDYFCVYCDRRSPGKMNIDHIDPVCHGGKDELENYVPACTICNGPRFKGGSRLKEPGLSLLRTMAERNAPAILKALHERKVMHTSYDNRMQQLTSNVQHLPYGIRLKTPRTGDHREAMVLYSRLMVYPHFEDRIVKGEMYRLIDLKNSEEEYIADLENFLLQFRYDQKRLKESCRYLNNLWVILGNDRRRIVSDFTFYCRNDKVITENKPLTRIFRFSVRFLVNEKVRLNFHNIAQAVTGSAS